MGADNFSVTVEALGGLGNHLDNMAGWFSQMGSLVDTRRAQSAADSPLSAGALATFSQTMTDALTTTAKLLREDRTKLAQVAQRYRSVDQHAMQSSQTLQSTIIGCPGMESRPSTGVESRLPTLTAHQSQLTRGILEGIAGLDGVVAPIARTVTGASDRVQVSLRSGADDIERTSTVAAEDLRWVNPAAGLGVLIGGATAAEVLRAADRGLESAEEVVRDIAHLAEDLSVRAERVLIRPTPSRPVRPTTGASR